MTIMKTPGRSRDFVLHSPPHGVCPSTRCPRYGVCHCGCGSPTRIVQRTERTRNRIANEPLQWLWPAHAPQVSERAPTPRMIEGRQRGGRNRRTVDRERVRPLVEFLVQRLGSRAKVAEWCQLHRATIDRLLWPSSTQPVLARTARAVSEGVLALREERNERFDPLWNPYEEPTLRRHLSPFERAHIVTRARYPVRSH